MMKKRIIAALLAVLSVGLLLSACGSTPAASTDTTAPTTDAAPSTDAPAADAPAAPAQSADTPVTEMTQAPSIAPAADTISDEEYKSLATTLATASLYFSAHYEAVDLSDKAAKDTFSDMKKPFEDFKALTAPAKFADVQTQYVTSCDTMIAAADKLIAVVGESDSDKVNTALNEASTLVQQSQTELNTAASAMNAA